MGDSTDEAVGNYIQTFHNKLTILGNNHVPIYSTSILRIEIKILNNQKKTLEVNVLFNKGRMKYHSQKILQRKKWTVLRNILQSHNDFFS